MIRNWYELSLEELSNRKEKLLDLFMNMKPSHPKHNEVWKALGEIAEAIEILTIAEDDEFVRLVVEQLCF